MQVPRDIPKEASAVDLRGNNIQLLDAGNFSHLAQCTKLSLIRNIISAIHIKAFEGMKSLRMLLLQLNKISHIEPQTFLGLASLKSLNLFSNKLTRIQCGMMEGLHKLTELDIRKKKISVVEEGAFNPLYAIQTLSLHGNQLRTINQNLFKNFPRPFQLSLGKGYCLRATKWDCRSLCWLKHEEQKGTVKWRSNQGCPCCSGSIRWNKLHCAEGGELACRHVPINDAK